MLKNKIKQYYYKIQYMKSSLFLNLIFIFLHIITISAQNQPADHQQISQQQKYFDDYAKYMQNFQSTQIFLFQMDAHGFQQFQISIPQNALKLRGLYLIESDQDKNLLVWFQKKSIKLITELNKKMYVFNIQNITKGEVTVFFKNMNQKKDMFFTYEIVMKDKIIQFIGNNELLPALQQFKTLSASIENSDFIIKTLVTSNIRHSQRLLTQKKINLNYAIFQTIILIVIGSISLGLLYRTIKKGYISII